jgi:predicted ATPase/class 3 adenylate cyclase
MTNSMDPSLTLPSGTVTFLFTDIEGSTELLKQLGDQYARVLADQRRILREIFTRWNGKVVDSKADEFFVSFPRATDAVSATVDAQKALAEHEWPEGVQVRVRMGLHTGEPLVAEEGYVGMDVHKASRIGDVGHGGQVLLSETTAVLVRDELPNGTEIMDLGQHRLKDLEHSETIYQLTIEGMASDFPQLRSLDHDLPPLPPHSFPTELTSFVGRREEMQALEALIADPEVRLVTIIGSGGMGKTRLALAIAERLLVATRRTNGRTESLYPHGIYFISLAPLDSTDSIIPTIAETLDFRLSEKHDPNIQLINYLSEKELLLIMDNYEHLLNGTEVVAKILKSVPNVKVVATSRARLNVGGEHRFHLQGMDYPKIKTPPKEAVEYSSIRLFHQCASRAKLDFDLNEHIVSDVIRICTLLDGIPLGIRLAASWVNTLSPEEIVIELERGLDLLEADMQDIPERHSSMRAVFDHSWQLLTERECHVLAGLSIFRGGFSRDAAEYVTEVNLREMKSLINKSLVNPTPSGRYNLHELLRQFLEEKLQKLEIWHEEVKQRHCAFYTLFLAEREEALKGIEQLRALAEIEADIGNIRLAWDEAIQKRSLPCLEGSIFGLSSFYTWRNRYQEGERAFRSAVDTLSSIPERTEEPSHSGERQRVLAKILSWQSKFCEHAEAEKLVNEAIRVLTHPELAEIYTRREQAFAYQRLGDLWVDSNIEEAQKHFNESLRIYRDLGDDWSISNVLTSLGWVASHRGDFKEVIKLGEESLGIKRRLKDLRGEADALWLLGTVATVNAEVDRAKRLITESLGIRDSLGDRIIDIEPGPIDLGMTLTWIGEMQRAHDVREETLMLLQEQGLLEQVANAHQRLATSKLHLGRYEEAKHHAQIALEMSEVIGSKRDLALSYAWLSGISFINGDYQEAESLSEKSISLLRSLEGADELGWVLSNYSIFSDMKGQKTFAKKAIYESLQICSGLLGTITALNGVASFARVISDSEKERAIKLFALCSKYPLVSESCFINDIFKIHFDIVAESLRPEVVEEARAKGRNCNLQETVSKILAELRADLKS